MSELDRESALRRFRRSLEVGYQEWHDGISFDLEALREATQLERAAIEELLLARGVGGWREVEALARLDTPRARAALRDAFDRGDPEVQLAVLRHAGDLVDEEERTAALVRALEESSWYGGLSQALDAATEHHPPAVVVALWRGLRARDGEAAVHFAALLAFLHGRAAEPFGLGAASLLPALRHRGPARARGGPGGALRAARSRAPERCRRPAEAPSARVPQEKSWAG
jgi:hypothetical protein